MCVQLLLTMTSVLFCAPQGALPGMIDQAITTCDPEVVAELLARQDDFPKVWGRESFERLLQTVAGAAWLILVTFLQGLV